MGRYRVGCTGWGYDDWQGGFYPPGSPASEYLARYARVFDLVEVDSSFYRPPSVFLTRRWADQTPEGFLFSLKLPRDITHHDPGSSLESMVRSFLEAVHPLRDSGKLGPLVAQYPPSFRRDRPGSAERFDRLLALVPSEYRLAVELRHGSWWTEATLAALRARGAALVWSVVPGARAPFEATADFLYVRFVGDRALTRFDGIQRDGREEMLAMHAHLLQEGRSAREAFLLLNNHFMGFGPGTARLMQEMLGLPRADLGRAQREADQRTLAEFP